MRYGLLRQRGSRVGVRKASIAGEVQAGLIALANIEEGELIFEVVGVMSEDDYNGETFSVIRPHRSQACGFGRRILVGPLRFANHSCSPNASVSDYHPSNAPPFEPRHQAYPCPQSLGWILQTRRKIAAGQPITISYGTDYWSSGSCLCEKCHPGELRVKTVAATHTPEERRDTRGKRKSDEEESDGGCAKRRRRVLERRRAEGKVCDEGDSLRSYRTGFQPI